MNPVIRFLLAAYKLVVQVGLVHTRPGRALFLLAYRIYKRIEHRHVHRLAYLVAPGTWVLDVGANVGFLTCRFAQWVSEGGQVIAIEPEAVNYAELCRAVNKAGLSDRTQLIQAVASDRAGETQLVTDIYNPANHRMGSSGIPTRAVTLDALTIEKNSPPVSLVKIDTQGAEVLVLKGADRLIQRDHPALVVEVYEIGLHEFGTSSRELLDYIAGYGYQIHQLAESGLSAPITIEHALQLAESSGYEDFVLLHPASSFQPR